MQGKTVVITGATSGIGEVAALRLAEKGARILFVARDAARAAATMEKLRRAGPLAAHAFHLADLSRLAEMKRIGALLAVEPRIDVLVNNAGAIFNRRRETDDGLEMTFALNHMAYFVVTTMLLGKLARGARIISTASGAHRRGTLDFDDLQSRQGYGGWRAYCRSKLCNILFTRELARRIASGVTANAFHPGFVATRFGDGSGGLIGGFVGAAKAVGALSAEEGAKTLVHLAASPQVEGISGEYFYQCRPEVPAKAARDDAAARRLWDVSERIAAL
jgi:NAD(P)-dependent dehydrogenase (short-subunit alcohol dehydrogenase family)